MHDLWQVYGDTILAVISGLGTVLTTLITYLMKRASSQRASMIKAVTALAESFDAYKKEAGQEHQKIALKMENFQGQLNLIVSRVDTLKDDTKVAQGRTDAQNATITKLTEAVVLVTSKLEAVFRILDAPKRTSDGRIK